MIPVVSRSGGSCLVSLSFCTHVSSLLLFPPCGWSWETCLTRCLFLFPLFSFNQAPPEQDLEWDAAAILGASRWLGRVWRLVQNMPDVTAHKQHKGSATKANKAEAALAVKVNETISRVAYAFSYVQNGGNE